MFYQFSKQDFFFYKSRLQKAVKDTYLKKMMIYKQNIRKTKRNYY